MVATLDVVAPGVAISGSGLIATSSTDLVGARTSVGHSTGKRLFRGTIITPTRPNSHLINSGVSFGFMTSDGELTTAVPGDTGSPAGTAFGIGPFGEFTFSNAIWRLHNQNHTVWVLTSVPHSITYAIDLDAKKYWFNIPGIATPEPCWYYDGDNSLSPPVPDPDLLVGRSYADMIDGDTPTLYPYIFIQDATYSGSVEFDPDCGDCTPPDYTAWDDNPPPVTRKHTHVFA